MKNCIIILLVLFIVSCNNNPTGNEPIENNDIQLRFKVVKFDSVTYNQIGVIYDTTFTTSINQTTDSGTINYSNIYWQYLGYVSYTGLNWEVKNLSNKKISCVLLGETNISNATAGGLYNIEAGVTIDTIKYGFSPSVPFPPYRFFTEGNNYKMKYKIYLYP